MVTEVCPGIFRIEVPLPQSPLRSLNSYLIKGEEKDLLVDLGFNHETCAQALNMGLKEVGIKGEIDCFLTHMHADHSGLVSSLGIFGKVYCSSLEAELINSALKAGRFSEIGNNLKHNGFPQSELDNSVASHPARRYCSEKPTEFTVIKEGDLLDLGGYRFIWVETPGHTPQHMCLYEPSQQILIGGDHILDSITPNITLWRELPDTLGSYLASLDKIAGMEVKLVLPGHRGLIHDCRRRIAELKEHHRERLEEIQGILSQKAMNAYEVASHMSWSFPLPWDQFPVSQKWFATGEAMSHLEHLRHQGRLEKLEREGIIEYRIPS